MELKDIETALEKGEYIVNNGESLEAVEIYGDKESYEPFYRPTEKYDPYEVIPAIQQATGAYVKSDDLIMRANIEGQQYPKGMRSVSQIGLFEKCPYAYHLRYAEKYWQRPAVWLPQGVAVHEAMEKWEASNRTLTYEQVEEIYVECYRTMINKLGAETPNFDFWFRSGPYAPDRDIPRRFNIGKDQLKALMDYSADSTDRILEINGKLCLEERFVVCIGGVPLVGFIDQVVQQDDGQIIVRDIKTGKKPGDTFQLQVYAEALRIKYGLDNVRLGDYFMAHDGKPSRTFILDEREEMIIRVQEANEGIMSGESRPTPSKTVCNFCGFNLVCEFREG